MNAAGSQDLDHAFADLTHWRKIAVEGSGSLVWLDTIVSGSVAELSPGRARPVELLSPHGDRLADFTVSIAGSTVLLLQNPAQRLSILELLAPRIQSGDVALDDRSAALSLFSFPGRYPPPEAPGAVYCSPSCLGSGIDLVALMSDRKRLITSLSRGWQLVALEEIHARRTAAAETDVHPRED